MCFYKLIKCTTCIQMSDGSNKTIFLDTLLLRVLAFEFRDRLYLLSYIICQYFLIFDPWYIFGYFSYNLSWVSNKTINKCRRIETRLPDIIFIVLGQQREENLWYNAIQQYHTTLKKEWTWNFLPSSYSFHFTEEEVEVKK